MPLARLASVEPFLRGCAWPSGELAAYPRCDPGPLGRRLPVAVRVEISRTEDAHNAQRSDVCRVAACGPHDRARGASAHPDRCQQSDPARPRDRLPEGIHPDDAGNILLTLVLGPALGAALEGARHA